MHSKSRRSRNFNFERTSTRFPRWHGPQVQTAPPTSSTVRAGLRRFRDLRACSRIGLLVCLCATCTVSARSSYRSPAATSKPNCSASSKSASSRPSAHSSTPSAPRCCTVPSCGARLHLSSQIWKRKALCLRTFLERQPLELLFGDLLRPLGADLLWKPRGYQSAHDRKYTSASQPRCLPPKWNSHGFFMDSRLGAQCWKRVLRGRLRIRPRINRGSAFAFQDRCNKLRT
jgi:hypothetical protein